MLRGRAITKPTSEGTRTPHRCVICTSSLHLLHGAAVPLTNFKSVYTITQVSCFCHAALKRARVTSIAQALPTGNNLDTRSSTTA